MDGALEFEIRETTGAKAAINIAKCKYAEMYREHGLEAFGYLLSCGRDYEMIDGSSDFAGSSPVAYGKRVWPLFTSVFHTGAIDDWELDTHSQTKFFHLIMDLFFQGRVMAGKAIGLLEVKS